MQALHLRGFLRKMEQAHKMHKGYMIITWKQHVSYRNWYHMYQYHPPTHPHLKLLCPSKIKLVSLSLISVPWLSVSPHPHCF